MAETSKAELQPETPAKASVFLQVLAAAVASMNALSMGCAIGWYSPASVVFEKHTATHFSFYQLTSISAIFLLTTGLTMMILGPFVIPKIGGNRTALIYTTPFLIGSWLLLLIDHFVPILLGRIFIGICGGVGAVAAPLFIGEMSEPRIRGSLSIMYQFMLCLGVLIIFAFGVLENKYWLVGPSVVISASCLGLLFMWESPMYYLKHDNLEKARKALRFYRGKKYDLEPEIEKQQQYLQELKTGESTWELMKKRGVRRAMLICTSFHIFQQCSGIKSMILYSHAIFAEVYNKNTHTSSLVVMLTLVLTTILSAYLVEVSGRKLLLMISYGLMTLTHIGLASFFFAELIIDEKFSTGVNMIAVVLCCLYILVYSLGAGPVAWTYQAELFPAKTKFIASAFAGGMNWITAFIMLVCFPIINKYLGMAYSFLLYAFICFIGFFFAIFVAVETKGKNLYEIQEMLSKK